MKRPNDKWDPRRAIAAQRRWIEAHGGNLVGYIAYYGAASDPNHYGDGGEAIYGADCAQLEHLMGLAESRERP